MNSKLFLLAISVAAISSCTTLYKSGQTPDDVYYSPTRAVGGGEVENRKEPENYQANNYNSDERTIRLGINDYRYRYLDNNYNFSNSLYINDYSYTPYSYGFNYGYYYNPFFWPYPVYGYGNIFINPSNPKNTTPRMTNLSTYNPVYNNSRFSSTTHGGPVRPVRTYNSNRGSAVGNVIRQVLSPSNSNSGVNNSNNNSSSNRSYSPSSSSSSSSGSSSSGGSGGGVSRPSRN